MNRSTRIELQKEHFKFSAGHFTIFSAAERENLHGHNFTVGVTIDSHVDDNGLAFDYSSYKEKVATLCAQLNERFLLPGNSPHVRIEKDPPYIVAAFNGERIPFLERDALVLPVRNVTLEELSRWFLDRLLDDSQPRITIDAMTVRVYSGPGQSASAQWRHGDSQ